MASTDPADDPHDHTSSDDTVTLVAVIIAGVALVLLVAMLIVGSVRAWKAQRKMRNARLSSVEMSSLSGNDYLF